MRRVALVATLAGALALSGCGDGGGGDGPLDGGTAAGHTSPLPIAEPYDFFSVFLRNRGDEPIEIRRVRLRDVSGSMQLDQVRLRLVPDEGPPLGGGLVSDPSSQDPPSRPLVENRVVPVASHRADSGKLIDGVQVLFRVRMPEDGISHSAAVEVAYKAGGKRYEETYPFRMTLCAPRAKYTGNATTRCGHELAEPGSEILG